MAGETRGNLAAGGRGEARPLTPRDRGIGEALAPLFAKRGMLFAGIDVFSPLARLQESAWQIKQDKKIWAQSVRTPI